MEETYMMMAILGSVLIFMAVLVAVLFYFVMPRNPKIDDPVEGRFRVTGGSGKAAKAVSQSATLTGVLLVPGRDALAMSTRTMMRTDQYPSNGEELPVVFSASDPSKMIILWDRVPSASQRAQFLAQLQARALNQARREAEESSNVVFAVEEEESQW